MADSVWSEAFSIDQGLRQGGVLAPLLVLFNIFFTVALNIALWRFPALNPISDIVETIHSDGLRKAC